MKFDGKTDADKIIFLDVDGVLNSQSYYIEWMRRRRVGVDYDNSEKEIDESCVKNLKEIVDKTGAAIVLSSTYIG